jgi:hypothetical protein
MRVAVALALITLSLLACRSATGTSEQARPASGASSTSASAPTPAPARPASASASATEQPSPSAAPDHAERLADLDMLCAALDRDYVDGTLSDYYAKLEPRTAWGRERLREGEDSITPGRLLQQAATSIAADLDSPALARCKPLFEVLDELE